MMLPKSRTFWSATTLSCVLLMVLVLSISIAPVLAQEPTPTPNDPVWRAFSTVRDTIEEERSVNLSLIQSYTFDQTEFPTGIEVGCIELEEGVTPSPVYWGWTFVVTGLNGQSYQARISFDLKSVIVCDQVVVAPANTEATTDGDLPAPVAGAAATGSFELGGHILELNANTVSLLNSAGMTWVKKQLSYQLGDDPSKAQGLINQAKANGFKILLGIVGNQSQMGDFNSYIQSYASFVGGVAALGADGIEVWNEPNIDREWPAGSINGANYTQLLAAAFNSIKSSNPNTLVISGAPAPTGFFGTAGCGSGGCNDDVFMQQMAQAGAAQYMDCVGLHYNEGIVPPTQTGGDPAWRVPQLLLRLHAGARLQSIRGHAGLFYRTRLSIW